MKRYNQPIKNQTPGIIDIYMDTFGYKEDGVFVNVGAHDGVSYDVCYPLVQANWSGLQIEPNPAKIDQLKNNMQNYDKIKILECAASNKNGKDIIYIDDSHRGNVSTLNNYYATHIYPSNNKLEVEVKTLDTILHEENIAKYFDVLSIDVEGHETLVLSKSNIQKWMPQLVVIECNKHDSLGDILENGKKRFSIIDDYFISNNYEEIYSNDINSVYKRK